MVLNNLLPLISTTTAAAGTAQATIERVILSEKWVKKRKVEGVCIKLFNKVFFTFTVILQIVQYQHMLWMRFQLSVIFIILLFNINKKNIYVLSKKEKEKKKE